MNTESDVTVFLISRSCSSHSRTQTACRPQCQPWPVRRGSPTPVQATCRRGSSLSIGVVGLTVTEFAEVSALVAHEFFFPGQLPLYLPAVYIWEITQAQFVTKRLVRIFYVYLSMNKQKLLLLLWISQWNRQENPKTWATIRKAALPLDAAFLNAVLYFASSRLPLNNPPKCHSFSFFPHCTETAAMSELVENVLQPNNNNKRKNHLTQLNGMLIRVLS